MCGIFVYAGKEKVDAKACLARLAHRGPDHEDILHDGVVTFGHRRLSIIDVDARSDQPMTSISGKTSIVFNGEIYNYRELRAELIKEGVVFRTEGDTEVILAGYERHGATFFDRLRGMWAFVIFDREKGQLISARDPFGVKPLVYALHKESVYFASEIKCLKGAISLEPNPSAYAVFYNLGYFIAPATPYKNVWKLRPGEVLSWDLATGKMSAVGHISRFAGESKEVGSYTEALDLLDHSLTASVEAHYVSDVPVSILLSGGTDSSIVAALSKKIGKQPIAYHVAIAGSTDTAYATAVANHLGMEIVVESLSEESLSKQYEKVWGILDEPTGDISIIPTSLVYERIKGKAKVVLSGEGGDELFGGYLRARMLTRHPAIREKNSVNRGLNSLLSTSPTALSVWNPAIQKLRGALFERGISNDLIGAYLKSVRLMDYPLYDEEVRKVLYELYQSENSEVIASALVFDTIAYLSNDLLPKSDIASMASSIEARVPFVDRMLTTDVRAALVQSRPLGDKQMLKEILTRYLPHNLVFRDKSGFGVPMHNYDSRAFIADFHQACAFHLGNKEAFGVDTELAQLISSESSRNTIVRKYPRFAFALISNWKLFGV